MTMFASMDMKLVVYTIVVLVLGLIACTISKK